MVRITKVKASSITETIVATTIIIIVFTVVTLSLNNVLRNSVENDTSLIQQKMHELVYSNQHKKIALPITIKEKNWELSLFKEQRKDISYIVIEAEHIRSKKKIIKTIIDHEN